MDSNENKDDSFQSLLQQISAFYDPLSLDIMVDPVIINGEGISYDASALKMWVQRCYESGLEVTSPLTRVPFKYPDDVSPNVSLKTAIEEVSAQLQARFSTNSTNALASNEPVALRTILSGLEGSVTGISSDIFYDLDSLRDMDLMKTLNLKTPQIIVFGDEKDGKSTLLERVVGFPIFPSRKELSTLCIIRVHLRRRETTISQVEVLNRSTGEVDKKYGVQQIPLQLMSEVLQKLMDDMVEESVPVDINMPNRKRIISDKEIKVTIQVPYCPNLDVLDLPGLVNNPKDVREATRALADSVIAAESDHSIFLMVVKSLSNASQSLAPSLVTEHELFHKTLGVLTHLDRFESDDEDQTTEEALRHMMSPLDQNFFDLGRQWLGCASKMPPKSKELPPMTRLLQTEWLEMEILEKKFPSFLEEEKPKVGLPAIRCQVTADFEKFICENWVDNMTSHLIGYFFELSDENVGMGLPMPSFEEYHAPIQKMREIVPEIIPDYDVPTMLKLSDAAEYKKIIVERSNVACRDGEWLQLSTCSFWDAKKELEMFRLNSNEIDFDKSFEEMKNSEALIIAHFRSIVAGVVEHGNRVSKLYVAAALQVLPQQKEAQGNWLKKIRKFVLSTIKPEQQAAALKVDRFDGLLESYSEYMDVKVREINCAYEMQANALIEGVKGRLISRKYICTEDSEVFVLLEWSKGMSITEFGDSLVSLWLDQLMDQVPTLTTTWNVPAKCLRETVSGKRVKLLTEMAGVAHALRALKSLSEKYAGSQNRFT